MNFRRTHRASLLLTGALAALAAGCADESLPDPASEASPSATESAPLEPSSPRAQQAGASCAPTTVVKEAEFNKSLNKDVALIQPLGPYKVVIEVDPVVP